MSNTTRYLLNAVPKGVLLAAMLASAGALAGSPANDVNDVNEAARQQSKAPAARTEVGDPDQSLPRKKAALSPSRKAPPARVFLEDFERVHKQVNRQYPTGIYWVGKNPQSK